MLLKLMKHDFKYSAKTLFALSAIVVILSAIFVFTSYMVIFHSFVYAQQPESYYFSKFAHYFTLLLLVVVAVVTIIHIAYFYRKSMFGRFGYLALTMPVSRGSLLASKLAVSFIWFSIYAVLITLTMVVTSYIVWPDYNFSFLALRGLGFGSVFAESLITWANHAAYAFVAIALVFFCITLSHTVLANVHLRGIISGAIGLLSAGLYIIGTIALANRSMVELQRVFAEPRNLPLVGLQYGRIVIDSTLIIDRGMWYYYIYIDIFFLAFTLAIAAIAIAATHYLLKRRVSI